MPRPYEITILLLGLGVLGYVFVLARNDFGRIPHGKVLLSSFIVQFFSWILSGLHRSLLPSLPEAFEALLTAAATILIGIWCYLLGKPEARGER